MIIRLANKEDFDFFLKLKSEDFNIFWVGAETIPDKIKLMRFFYDAVENASKKNARKIFIVENEQKDKIGHLYIIPDGDIFELSIALLNKYCGKGYAKHAIRLGLEKGKEYGFKKMKTKIREDNIASMKAYLSCGVKKQDDFVMVYIPKLGSEVKMYYMEYVF